jgi:hypothetical protein
LKLAASVSMPVVTSCPVIGHLMVTTPIIFLPGYLSAIQITAGFHIPCAKRTRFHYSRVSTITLRATDDSTNAMSQLAAGIINRLFTAFAHRFHVAPFPPRSIGDMVNVIGVRYGV